MSNRGKFNIGLDLDGVIIDHTENKIKIAESFGFKIKKSQTSSNILEKIMPEKEYRILQNKIYGAISLGAKPVNSSLKYIKNLSQNHNLFIISRRRNPNMALAWLKKYGIFEFIPKEKIFFVKEEKDKDKVAERNKIDIFLDDKTEVLETFFSVPRLFLFDPCQVSDDGNFKRVDSWPAFSEEIKKGV